MHELYRDDVLLHVYITPNISAQRDTFAYTYTQCATFLRWTCVLSLLANSGSEQPLQFSPVLLMSHNMQYKNGSTLWYGVWVEIACAYPLIIIYPLKKVEVHTHLVHRKVHVEVHTSGAPEGGGTHIFIYTHILYYVQYIILYADV